MYDVLEQAVQSRHTKEEERNRPSKFVILISALEKEEKLRSSTLEYR